MADDDDIEIVDDQGEEATGESLFGTDPDSLGVDATLNEFPNSSSDRESAISQSLQNAELQNQQFGYTWQFDEIAGDFVKKGKEPVRVSELDAFAEWVQNVIRTQRRLYSIYSEDFGVDHESVIGKGTGTFLISSFLEAEIKDALSVHIRFKTLESFQCQKSGEDVTVQFAVTTTDGQVQIDTTISGA